MKLISKEIYIVFGVYFETGKTIVNNHDDLDFSIDDCKANIAWAFSRESIIIKSIAFPPNISCSIK